MSHEGRKVIIQKHLTSQDGLFVCFSNSESETFKNRSLRPQQKHILLSYISVIKWSSSKGLKSVFVEMLCFEMNKCFL